MVGHELDSELTDSFLVVTQGKNDYHIYLNATRYTVEPGHSLAIVIATEDPVNCMIHKTYSVEIDNSSVHADVPVTTEENDYTINAQ